MCLITRGFFYWLCTRHVEFRFLVLKLTWFAIESYETKQSLHIIMYLGYFTNLKNSPRKLNCFTFLVVLSAKTVDFWTKFKSKKHYKNIQSELIQKWKMWRHNFKSLRNFEKVLHSQFCIGLILFEIPIMIYFKKNMYLYYIKLLFLLQSTN